MMSAHRLFKELEQAGFILKNESGFYAIKADTGISAQKSDNLEIE
jgi:DNA-binding transcriptional regulator YhcF (GntR family)